LLKINVFWFRRDLRLDDNAGLNAAMAAGLPVLPLFIFDTEITADFHADDARISFIYDSLQKINKQLLQSGSSILIKTGSPRVVWDELISTFNIDSVFFNRDYEPYTIKRDNEIINLLKKRGITSYSFKDQVIFEEREVIKPDGTPYTMFTPYSKAWMRKFSGQENESVKSSGTNFTKAQYPFPELSQAGFTRSAMKVAQYDLTCIRDYDKHRDFPAADRTTRLGPHLRFGTVSIRKIVRLAANENQVFLGELIWREFFMQILFNFPHVVTDNFRPKYNGIAWRNNENEFRRWCNAETGYPIVDAGMRQLSETGYMHNRVRMITASFLCKHLLTDWRWGEAWFAEKLNDYELASNNGNWQWAAGTGCDASPWFRIFNPHLQQKKYDREGEYIRKWAGDYGNKTYPPEIINHVEGRERAIQTYKNGLSL
jgi:deoxyribodipyrimidine photo-lyase